ncbi:hypothetical protein Trydic_g12796 [Trypoxylus dichotomus]
MESNQPFRIRQGLNLLFKTICVRILHQFGPFLLQGTSFIPEKETNYESINDWSARLRSLATHCEFDEELDVCLRDRFIMGFPTVPILDRLLDENLTITLADAMKIAGNKIAARDHYGIFEAG